MQDYAQQIFKKFIPSNSGIKKGIKRGQFLINGKKAETGTWVSKGQVIDLVENLANLPKVYEFNLSVIFEDDHIAIINKPAGIIVSGNKFRTIYNALPFNLKKSNEPDTLLWPTPVHRLDSQTSGILVIAKTKTAQIELGKQFKNKTVKKTYCTIAVGSVLTNTAIKLPIENKISETTFEIIRTGKSLKYGDLSFLKVYPKTGRTHQIRIHLASIGHPILGEKIYGNLDKLHHRKGLFLCAMEIAFLHPKTLKRAHFKLDIPHKFKSFLIREKRRYKTYHK